MIESEIIRIAREDFDKDVEIWRRNEEEVGFHDAAYRTYMKSWSWEFAKINDDKGALLSYMKAHSIEDTFNTLETYFQGPNGLDITELLDYSKELRYVISTKKQGKKLDQFLLHKVIATNTKGIDTERVKKLGNALAIHHKAQLIGSTILLDLHEFHQRLHRRHRSNKDTSLQEFYKEVVIDRGQGKIGLKQPEFYGNYPLELYKLKSLDYLEHLELPRYQKLKNSDLEDIATLTNLTSLKIPGAELGIERSAIPMPLSLICRLTNLKELYLQNNDLKDIGSISKLKNLRILSLSENRDISDFSPLTNLNNLEELYLNYSGIYNRHMPILSKLTSLKKLQLEHNTYLKDVSGIANLVNLEELSLVDSDIINISVLSKLTNLKTLNLRYTKVKDITPLVSLEKLELLLVQPGYHRTIKIPDELKDKVDYTKPTLWERFMDL